MRLRWRAALVTFARSYNTSLLNQHHHNPFHQPIYSHSRRLLCSKTNDPNNKVESNVSKYEQQYRQLDNLDFMTASKMLFTDPPKKKKFGLDFHLVQLFFACLPSLAVFLVAQYARHEMRKMDAELEKKKKEEEEKAKEIELNAAAEKEAEREMISKVKAKLEKLEETVNEIVLDSKKKSEKSSTSTEKEKQSNQEKDKEETSTSIEKEKQSNQNLAQEKDNQSAPAHSSSKQEDPKGKKQTGGPCQGAKS